MIATLIQFLHWYIPGDSFLWTHDGEHSGCAVLMGNRGEATKRMEMGTAYAGQTFRDLLGHLSEEITIAEDGWGEFRCPVGGVSVWAVV